MSTTDDAHIKVETLSTRSGGHDDECDTNRIRSNSRSHVSCSISYASIVSSSRINASALIRAFSSRGGDSSSIFAISRLCCFDNADFLFEAIEKRVTAIFNCGLSFDASYPPKIGIVVLFLGGCVCGGLLRCPALLPRQ